MTVSVQRMMSSLFHYIACIVFSDFSGGSLERRSLPDGGSIQKPANALATFNLTFNFFLEQDLRVVTKGELLLFQVPLTRDDYITAQEQYVEIKVVLEKLRMKSVVVGKYIKVFDSGFQIFDITAAIQTWISKGLDGPLKLEVTVFCFTASCTSPNSEGRDPKFVRFMPDYHSKEHAPRIVVTSQNPLEAADQHRSKRQTQGSGLSFCVNNQSICCLKQLRINFSRDLGFDFITKPLEYEANYCDGVCPISPGSISPLLFHYLSRLKDSPASSAEPCCAGNTYKDLHAMVVENGTERLRILHRVRVTSCHCG